MTALFGFIFDNIIGKAAVLAIGALALFSAWLWRHDAKVAQQAETKVIERSVKAGKKAHAKASVAHRAARKPGAASRLLADSCRDCD